MDDHRRKQWKRVSAILDEALALSGDERAACIDRACAGDHELRAEVEALLAGASSSGFLESPAAAFAAPLIDAVRERDESFPIDAGRVGPYELVREIGRGGMGTVYLAERADGQFEQHVALKLIKRGMDSEEINRRFLAERQILARLNHPCIARLLDGGVTTHGLPWFAMEYVEGEPIDEYCNAHRLDVRQRLALFESACNAVRYAHQNLVVHRDLKPSNILVARDDQVKLLDFGIAKLLYSASEDMTLTRLDSPVMTPAYAAPEQVRAEPVTTATDVYTLGAVLYELLTGQRVHRFEQRTATEVQRIVCEVDPEPPSVAVARADELRQTDGTDPNRLRRQLRGDLDTIVCTALQKDPARRYATVDALLEDIKRYRAGEPVQARPASKCYRAGKFIRRHRVGFAATVALAVSLLAGIAGTLWQARSASINAARAQQEAAKATEVKDFVVGLFKAADPAESRGREITARELVDRGAQRVDTALTVHPKVQIELLHVLGEINEALGFYGQADTLFQRAAALARDAYGDASTETASELVARGEALWAAAKYDDAETVLTAALTAYRRTLDDNAPQVAEALANLAAVLAAKGEYGRAEPLYREALAIDRRSYGDEHVEVANDLNNLGVFLWRAKRLEDADSAARAALATKRRLLAPDHPSLLTTQHNVSLILLSLGELDEAERLERDALSKRRRLYPDGHPDIAVSLHQLSDILQARGRYQEAEPFLVEALELSRKLLGLDHPETITLVNNLAVLKYRIGDLEGAESATREVVAHFQRMFGEDHPATLGTRSNLGAILSDAGKYPEAESILRQTLSLSIRRFGEQHEQVAVTQRHLGTLLHRTRRYDEAEDMLRTALHKYRSALPTGHVRIAEALTALGALLNDRLRPAEAELFLREALAIRRENHGPSDARTAKTLRVLGVCLMALGRYQEAEAMLLDSYRVFAAMPNEEAEQNATARELVSLYEKRHEPAKAASYRRS